MSYRVDNFTFKWTMEMLQLIVGIFNYRGEWLHFNPCLLWKMMIPSPHHSLPSILIFECPCNPKLYLMFTSSRSVTIAHHISVTHLVNTACNEIQQVKFGKLDPSAKLQLLISTQINFWSEKHDQITDKQWLNQNTSCSVVFGLFVQHIVYQNRCFPLTDSIKSLNFIDQRF